MPAGNKLMEAVAGRANKPAKIVLPPPKVESVHQFVKLIMETKVNGADPSAFRGQKNYSWKGLAPIFRPGERLVDHEHQMVRELISVHPQEFQQDITMFDRLVRMQHYGLPTRLLDVTLNPLVALFFAAQDYADETEKDGKILKTPRDGKVIVYRAPEDRSKFFDSDTVSCISNLANLPMADKRAIQKFEQMNVNDFNKKKELKTLLRYIELERPMFELRIEPASLYRPIFVRPKNNNRRIIAQAGAFILYGLEATAGTKPYDTTIGQRSIRVPADKKPEIREQLGRLGIDASVLFPELDKAADIIAARYKKRLEDDLGI